MTSRTSHPHSVPDAARDDDHDTSGRAPVWARRVGYLIGALVNVALLVAVHEWPGWWAVPFLTDRTVLVLGMVNVTLVANLVAQLCYTAYDAKWFVTLGGLVTTAIGLVVIVRVWQVFPIDFDDGGFDWAQVLRILLVVGIVGSVIGLLVGLTTLLTMATGNHEASEHRS